MLAAQDLTVRIEAKALLDTVSASFAPGRVTTILGPNGAGKSTLLKCLTGLQPPSSGEALLDGRSVGALAPRERARSIGYLPQRAELHWNIGVRALVALGRYPVRGGAGRLSEADEAAVEQALAETDTAMFADRLAGSLSGGELARVLLARVLAGEPDWILADEPFASLDIAHRFDLSGHFRAIAARGVGVIVVLHDVGLAGRLADDVLLVDSGRIAAAGPAAEILASEALETVFGVSMDRHVHPDGTISLIPVQRFP
jgi:iron complex transport system ATP-binding protein